MRWLFYTSGTTADPKGAQHTDLTVMASALAMAECLDIRARRRLGPGLPVHPHRRHRLADRRPVHRVHAVDHRGLRPDGHPGVPGRQRRHPGRLGHALPPGLPGRPAGRTDGRAIFPHVRSYPGGGAPKPPQLHYDLKARSAGVGIVSGYGLTEAPIVVMATTDRPRPEAGRHRGTADPRRRAQGGRPRRTPGRAGRGGGDPAEGPPGHPAATSTRPSTPTPSTTTATSAAATWASSTPTAT